MTCRRKLILLVIFTLALAACHPAGGNPPDLNALKLVPGPTSLPTNTPSPQPTATAHPTSLPTVTPLPTQPPSDTPLPTATTSDTPLPAVSLTSTPVPIFVKLRGEVIVEQANCRYGPGAPYLYKYGLLGGSNLEIIGRNEPGSWIEIRAIGGNNPCWVKAELMKIKGDVINVAPVKPEDVRLPMSPFYGPLSGVSASRSLNEVTVSWNQMILRAGDDSEQYPYLVEAWVCQNHRLVFTPVGSYQPLVKVLDEPGCAASSHGRVYGVEKHGYTRWLEIPWPPLGASH